MIYKMTLTDSADSMTMDLLEVPIADTDVEGAVDNTTIDGNVFTDYLWLKKKYVQKWSIMCPDEYDRLRGFYTRQWTDASPAQYRLFYGKNIFTDYSESGDYIVVNNSSDISAPVTNFAMYGDATQHILPDGFQEVEYIQSSGTQRIETDYVFTQDDYIEITMTPMESGVDKSFFGAYEVSGYCELGQINQEIRGNLGGVGSGYSFTSGTKYTFTLESGQWHCNGTGFGNTRNTTSSLESFIFARNYSDTVAYKPSVMKLYSLKVTRGGSIAYYFIPCYRKSDGTIGVYEVVNGKFLTNSGTGTFTKGSDTTISPNPDYPQEIHTVTGENTLKIVGKNLFDINSLAQGAISVVDGVAIATASNFHASVGWNTNGVKLPFIPSGQVTITATAWTNGNASTAQNSGLIFRIVYSDGSYDQMIFDNNLTSPTTKTLVSNDSKTVEKVCITYGNTGSNVWQLTKVQIEEGTTATEFEDFSGQEQKIDLIPNVFDSSFEIGTINGSDGQNGSSANRIRSGYVAVDSSTQYTLSATSDYTLLAYIFEYASDKAYIKRIPANWASIPYIFTTSATTKFIRILFSKNPDATMQPTDAKSVLLVKAGTQSIELAKIGTYQDLISFDGAKWWLHKEVGRVVLDSSVAFRWGVANTGTPNYLYYYQSVSDAVTGATLMSNYGTGNILGGSDTNQGIMIAGGGLLRVRYGAEIPLEDWKAKFSTTPMILYYALATPTDTEITDSTLLSQLNAIYELYVKSGQNSIIVMPTSPNLQPDFDIGYRVFSEQETDIVSIVPVRLGLTDDGVINTCGCRRNIQLTMRETIQ